SLEAVAKDAVLISGLLWIVYVALEPYGRRFWPDMLIGWSRLLSGHLRDQRVGRDVLIGAGFGIALLLVTIARRLGPQLAGYAAPWRGMGQEIGRLLGPASTLAIWCESAIGLLRTALLSTLMFVVLRLLTRRAWLAIALGAFVLFYERSAFGSAPSLRIELILELMFTALLTLVFIRYGLLAAAIALLVQHVCTDVPFTLYVGHWSAAASNWTLAAVILLTLFGFYASRAGQPLFGTFEPGP